MASLSDLRGLLRRQESIVKLIAGRSHGSSNRFEQGQRVGGSQASLSFVREGDPAGRSRFELEPLVMESRDGRTFVVFAVHGYDGTVCWNLKRSEQMIGRDEEPVPRLEAQVTRTFESGMVTHPYTGWGSTLPGFYHTRRAWFSEVLDRTEVPFELTVAADGESVTLACRSKKGTLEEWELAREWRYCLRRYTKKNAGGEIVQVKCIEQATCVHQDFWYPTRVTGRTQQDSWSENRSEVTIEDVRLLDHVDDELFEPRFPHGTCVSDSDSGKVIRVAAEDSELSRIIGGQADTMRQLVLYDVGGSGAWKRAAAIAGIALGLVLVGIGLVRRRGRRTGSAAGIRSRPRRAASARRTASLIVVATMLAGSVVAQMPWELRHLRGLRGDNCAVNAVAFAARFFGRDVPIASIAARLGCDEGRVEAVGLDRMEVALRQEGVEAAGFRRASLAEVVARCGAQGGIAIVHIATGAPSGHFYVVGAAEDDVVVANPTYWVQRCGLDSALVALVRRLDANFSGNGLLLGDSGVRGVWHLEPTPEWVLELGNLAPGEREEGIAVRNDTAAPVVLRGAESSCGCFLGARLLPEPLPPGEEGRLVVRIDGARIGSGVQRQRVELLLESDSRALPRSLLLATWGSAAADLMRPCVVPSLVVADAVSGDRCGAFVTVVVPDGGLVSSWQGSPGVDAVPSVSEALAGGVAHRYRVSWSGDRAWITFGVLGIDGRIFSLRCHMRISSLSVTGGIDAPR